MRTHSLTHRLTKSLNLFLSFFVGVFFFPISFAFILILNVCSFLLNLSIFHFPFQSLSSSTVSFFFPSIFHSALLSLLSILFFLLFFLLLHVQCLFSSPHLNSQPLCHSMSVFISARVCLFHFLFLSLCLLFHIWFDGFEQKPEKVFTTPIPACKWTDRHRHVQKNSL